MSVSGCSSASSVGLKTSRIDRPLFAFKGNSKHHSLPVKSKKFNLSQTPLKVENI